MKFEHTSIVLNFEEKHFALSREDMLQGLVAASAKALNELGEAGWELVSVIPYVSPSARLMRQPGTDAAVGFFKRAKA
ncbi:MAG TPA: hypothetical protein VHD62_17525 [Opitutaceae bacterium]|nr:hypothetical protein [Opitutaceae bacterium]